MPNLSFRLARRLAVNTNTTGRTGTIVAVTGIAIAIIVMELTLAVSTGFKNQITQKLNGFVAPVTVSASANAGIKNRGLIIPDEITENVIASTIKSPVEVYSLLMQGMIKTENDFGVVVVKGYETDHEALFEKSNLVKGRWLANDDKRGLVVSSLTADKLGLQLGDRVSLCYFYNDNVKARPFEIVGIYNSGFSEYDKLMAYTNASAIRKLYDCPEQSFSIIELCNIPMDSAAFFSKKLKSRFYESSIAYQEPELAYNVVSVVEQGGTYLSWLELLETNVVVIFILMALIAICTLISGLFIQVLEKVGTIGLLRALGASNTLISRIFVYISLKMVLWGILIGNFIGIGLILLQSKFKFISLDAEMYYIDSVPVELNLISFVYLNIAIIVGTWLILLLPSRIATSLSPSATLRYD